MVEQVAPYLLAVAALYTAYIGFKKAMTEGDSVAAQNWQKLVDNFRQQIVDLQANEKEAQRQSAENRERIKALEKSELEAALRVAESQQRIKELEAANEQSKGRLLLLETDHGKLAELFKRYQRGVTILINQLRELNVIPAWTPDKEE